MQAGLGELVGRLQQEIKGSQVGVRSMQRLMTCEGNAADVASLMVIPFRSSAIQSPFGTQTPDVVPFQVKTMS